MEVLFITFNAERTKTENLIGRQLRPLECIRLWQFIEKYFITYEGKLWNRNKHV